jgi:hypothetical protein
MDALLTCLMTSRDIKDCVKILNSNISQEEQIKIIKNSLTWQLSKLYFIFFRDNYDIYPCEFKDKIEKLYGDKYKNKIGNLVHGFFTDIMKTICMETFRTEYDSRLYKLIDCKLKKNISLS